MARLVFHREVSTCESAIFYGIIIVYRIFHTLAIVDCLKQGANKTLSGLLLAMFILSSPLVSFTGSSTDFPRIMILSWIMLKQAKQLLRQTT